MIRKYIVCSKQPYLTVSRSDTGRGRSQPLVELLLPLPVFWEVEELLKKADYLIAAGEDPVTVNEVYGRVFRKLLKYAVHEKERYLLHARAMPANG